LTHGRAGVFRAQDANVAKRSFNFVMLRRALALLDIRPFFRQTSPSRRPEHAVLGVDKAITFANVPRSLLFSDWFTAPFKRCRRRLFFVRGRDLSAAVTFYAPGRVCALLRVGAVMAITSRAFILTVLFSLRMGLSHGYS
jgi:hypothetical protein